MKKRERKQYIFTILFTLIAMIIMVTYTLTTFYSNAVSNMVEMGRSTLKKETEHLDAYLTKGMDVLQVTAITIEYMMQNGASSKEIETFLLEESKRYMEDIDVNFTGIYGVFNGDYLDGIGWVPDEGYVPQEREWYVAARKAGGQPTVVSPYLDAQTGTVMISVSQMLYDNESVISLDIVLEAVQIITQEIQFNGMGYGFIIDREGLVVAHTNEKEKGKNYNKDTEMNNLLAKVYQDKGGTFSTTINGERCTVFVDTVMDNWYVTMIISNTKLYHNVRDILIQNVLICIVVFSVITYFCTAAFRKIGLHMRKSEESQQNLEKLNMTIMRTLARTIDAKDRYTNGHSQRVAKYALELARRMGKTEEEQMDIYYAALLHDLGKIHIPDAIINKPAKLNDEEYERIKLHPISGYYILRDIKENPLIAQGAKWHHENYDGDGYPDGIAGKNIPEIARIIGVADAYDAMTSNRSYREVMPQEQVRREIEHGKNTQFDPEIADIMLQMIDEDTNYQMKQKNDFLKRILVADDEQVNLDLIEYILKDEPGYTICAETSGREALQRMKEMEFDLVILDTEMPDMNGFEVCEEIRKTSQVPIVFLADDKNLQRLKQAEEMGIEDYLVKPFMPQALLEILHSILQERTSWQQFE